MRRAQRRLPKRIRALMVFCYCWSAPTFVASEPQQFVLDLYSGPVQFEMQSLTDAGISQVPYLDHAFRTQFQTLRDLTPDRLMAFLKNRPTNRDALVRYVVGLPTHAISDSQRVKLLRTIEQFRYRPPIQTIGTEQFEESEADINEYASRRLERTLGAGPLDGETSPRPDNHRSIPARTSQSESGLDFRFYRGLQVEYHFDSRPTLRLDVRRQRVEVEWMLD